MSLHAASAASALFTPTAIRAVIATGAVGDAVRSAVELDPDIEVVADCRGVAQAIAAIHNSLPDLLVIDEALAGVEDAIAAAAVANLRVIVTGCLPPLHASLASPAVECLPYGCSPESLEFALLRAKYRVQRARLEALRRLEPERNFSETSRPPAERIAVKAEHTLLFLRVSDIEWVHAAGNYVWLHGAQVRHKLRHTINGLLATLNSDRFIRVHRSAIVNLDRVLQFHLPGQGNAYALLESGVQLPVSRRYGRALRRMTPG